MTVVLTKAEEANMMNLLQLFCSVFGFEGYAIKTNMKTKTAY